MVLADNNILGRHSTYPISRIDDIIVAIGKLID